MNRALFCWYRLWKGHRTLIVFIEDVLLCLVINTFFHVHIYRWEAIITCKHIEAACQASTTYLSVFCLVSRPRFSCQCQSSFLYRNLIIMTWIKTKPRRSYRVYFKYFCVDTCLILKLFHKAKDEKNVSKSSPFFEKL